MSQRPQVWLTPEAFSRPTGGVRRYALELEAAVSTFADVERLGKVLGKALGPLVGRRASTAVSRSWSDLRGIGPRGGDSQIVHSCYYDCSSLGYNHILFATFHDCIHERFVPGIRTKLLSRDKRRSVERAEMIISISESTAADVADFYGLDANRSVVVYPPVTEAFTLGAVSDPIGVRAESQYLLHVGMRTGYKNFPLLLIAFAEFRSERSDFQLLAVGGGPFTNEENQLMQSLRLDSSSVKHVCNVTDEQLVALYQNSAAVVCPSNYEGFGYPAAEALCVGATVIVSNGGSLAEFEQFGAVCFVAGSNEGLLEALRIHSGRGTLLPEIRAKAISSFERLRFISQIEALYARSQ